MPCVRMDKWPGRLDPADTGSRSQGTYLKESVAKAAREVRIGDLLQIRTDGGDLQVAVLLLNEVRAPASVAQNALPRNGGEP
jgi:ribosomal 50S subunit-recycling heat shock protein